MQQLLRESDIEIRGPVLPEYAEILSADALRFVASLERRTRARRAALLAARLTRQAQFDAGLKPDFLPETHSLRVADWQVDPAPADLVDRRVEITGPVDRKMIINGLNSGARVFMADFEDSTSPTWHNIIAGQVNLRDAVRGTIEYLHPDGKEYRLAAQTATLMVRPRGWHLDEQHLVLDGAPVAGAIADFGLFFFHNSHALIARGSGPYFYLPKLESHLEARLWNEIFDVAQDALGIPRGTIKATVLIETLPAAFEMHEILHELRRHSAGLNCGRWDYLFSVIKKFRGDPAWMMPDRASVTMEAHFLRSYSRLLIQTCHRRGAHAMGGMSAYIPVKSNADANAHALARVRADKLREVLDGHDGTWVAHPGLLPVAFAVFNEHMPTAHQLHRTLEEHAMTTRDLLIAPVGAVTRVGLELNVNVALEYLEAWLGGQGCVPINNLMEDAATAEISRTQVWQWIRHGARLDDGTLVTRELVRSLLNMAAHTRATRNKDHADHRAEAVALLDRLMTAPELAEFLTVPAYRLI
ncbi:MAG: malate synthase A [Planctomycetota bacterium]